jgi:glycolate oxidase
LTDSHSLILEELRGAVGADYVSDDPAIMQAYSRTGWAYGRKNQRKPDSIVLPGSTGEVQSVVRIANRFRIPFIPVGSFLHWSCQASQPETIIIDMKRMDKIEKIDSKNMFALIQPFVTYTQLQAEAMKKKLWLPVPSSGGNTSALANHIFCGSHFAMHRIPYYARGILGAEWILPTGEIVKTGSAGHDDDYFWGEGPGPDLRGLMRGYGGAMGGLGVITKMAVRLYPWPGPELFPCKGVSPKKEFDFPANLYKPHLAVFPTTQQAVNAMYDICRAEIGIALTLVNNSMALASATRSKEEFQSLLKAFASMPEILLFISFEFSPGVVEYEKKVLERIVMENQGRFLPEQVIDAFRDAIPESMRSAVSMRVTNPAGGYDVYRSWAESMDNLLNQLDLAKKLVSEKHGDLIYFYYLNPIELGHYGHVEVGILYDPLTQIDTALNCQNEGLEQDVEMKIYVTGSTGGANRILGPAYSNYHLLLRKVKLELDPNNVSNPPYPIET